MCGQWLNPNPSGERIGAPLESAKLPQLALNGSGTCGFGGAGATGFCNCVRSMARTGSVLANQRVSPKPGLPIGLPSPVMSP